MIRRVSRIAGRLLPIALICGPVCLPVRAAAVGSAPANLPAGSSAGSPANAVSLTTLNTSPAAKDGPRMVLPESRQVRDNVADGSAVEFSFPIRNDGTRPLDLVSVMPSCACTVPSYDSTILPGHTGIIRAVLSVAPWSQGDVTRSLTVFSNDFAHSPQMLTLTAHVVRTIDVLPASAITIPYDRPAPITRVFTLRPHRQGVLNPRVLSLTGAPALSGPVTAKVERDPTQPGSYRVTVTLTPPPSGGDVLGEVDVPTGLAGIGPVQLTIQALGQKGITVTPASLDFGSVQAPGDRRQTILYSRKSVFRIRKITSSDPAVAVISTPGPGSGWYSLSASYKGGWKPGAHDGAITVTTDLAGIPPLRVPFTANVP